MKRASIFGLTMFLFAGLNAQTPCEDGMAGEYPCDGYDLYKYMPLATIGGGDNGNDCWGWVDEESGREFVIYGRSDGTSFIEITDPINPAYRATMHTESIASLWRDVKVIGDYAFIVSEAFDHGMQIFNLNELLPLSGFPFNISPTLTYSAFGNAHNIVSNPETNFLYAVGTNTFNGGLHIINVNDPETPLLAGSFSDFYTHDAQAVVYHGNDVDYQGQEIVFCFNGGAGIAIVNAEDKSDVYLIKHLVYEDVYYTHQGWLSEDHNMLYFNDELDEVHNGNMTRTYMMNVEDLDNPVIIGFYEAENTAIDHNLYTEGDKIYASNYTSGLRVSSILEDGAIAPQGYFDTYPQDDSTEFVGTWSNYPYFPSGSIAVSCFDGLFILKSSDYVGVEEALETEYEFSIYPNPSSSTIRLQGISQRDCSLKIVDLSGKVVLEHSAIPSVNGLNLDVSSLSEGVYLLNIIHPLGEILGASKLVIK